MTAGPIDTCVCICCRDLAPSNDCTADPDLEGPVCPDCRRHLMVASAQMKLGSVRVPDHGILQVNIRGCFKGGEAGDNRTPS